MTLRVMTYNIQHGHVHLSDHIDLTKTADVIRECGAEIIGLNEVRGLGKKYADYTAQVEQMAAYLGYHCYFGRSIYVRGTEPYGNAVLSKYPIVEASVIRIPDPVEPEARRKTEPRTLCRCVVEVPDGDGVRPVAVYASHFGLSKIEQEHAVSTAETTLRDERIPAVLMGDFNVTPDDPVLAPLNALLNGTDELLKGEFSFPSDKPRIKIDYIYTTKNVTPVRAEIVNVIASDHCPIWADLEL